MARAGEMPGKSWRLKPMQTLFIARSLPFVLAIMLLFLLSACAKTTVIGGTEAACGVWRPVSWSKKDTDQTITEIKVNNARREAWCHDAK
jgi:hypothetical protein